MMMMSVVVVGGEVEMGLVGVVSGRGYGEVGWGSQSHAEAQAEADRRRLDRLQWPVIGLCWVRLQASHALKRMDDH